MVARQAGNRKQTPGIMSGARESLMNVGRKNRESVKLGKARQMSWEIGLPSGSMEMGRPEKSEIVRCGSIPRWR